jgi:hypothetical protein
VIAGVSHRCVMSDDRACRCWFYVEAAVRDLRGSSLPALVRSGSVSV